MTHKTHALCKHCGHLHGTDHTLRCLSRFCACVAFWPENPSCCVECGHADVSHRYGCVAPLCECNGFLSPDSPAARSHPNHPSISTTPTPTGENTMSTPTPNTYTLPGGREYVSRNLAGYDDDVTGIRELAKAGKHTLLLGDPGTGKTALFQAAFPDAENEIGHSKLTAWDMLWRPRPMPDGSIQFDPSPLTRAATQGKPFYFDEIMRCSEDALTPLYSAMDGRGFIVGGNLDGTDMPVEPGFVVIAASNPLVRGAFLPDAIASRFHILDVEVSEKLLLSLGLNDRLMTLWRNLSAQEGGDVWRPSIRELLAAQDFINEGNWAQAAAAVTGWRVPARDRATVAGIVSPLFGVRIGGKGAVIS